MNRCTRVVILLAMMVAASWAYLALIDELHLLSNDGTALIEWGGSDDFFLLLPLPVLTISSFLYLRREKFSVEGAFIASLGAAIASVILAIYGGLVLCLLVSGECM